MKRRKKKRNNLVLAFIVLVVTMSLGYAFLNTDLTISGTGKITASSWNVFFDNIQVTTGSVSLSTGDSAPTIEPTNKTTVSYIITLKEPGEFYEFTVDVKNTGTIDAMIGTITSKMNGTEINGTNPLPAYLDYNISYPSGVFIESNHLLSANSTETFKIRLEFRTDIDPSDLPTSGATLAFDYGINYIQADDNAIPVPASRFAQDSWDTIIFNAVQNHFDNYHIGDTKTIELGNNLGTHTIRVANKSRPLECHTSTFSKTACGFVLEFVDIITIRGINSTSTIVGGWPVSEMRSYLNDVNDPTSMINSLPEILRNSIISTQVISGHEYGVSSNYESYDKIYLLSVHEIWKDRDNQLTAGLNIKDTSYDSTRQLDYYEELGITDIRYSNAIKYYNGTAYHAWLRSPSINGNNMQGLISNNGSYGYANAIGAYGVSPAFRLGITENETT